MEIQINGEQRKLPPEVSTLNELIETLSLSPQRIAIEVNKVIVRRRDWETSVLKDGDQIEIVHFVGGGLSEAEGERGQVRTSTLIGVNSL